MYSAEVMSQLRSLNWLAREIRRVPAGCSEAALLQNQIDAVRARLPEGILEYHDRLAGLGKSSVAEVIEGTCSECQAQLPARLQSELSMPGHFGVCPGCGHFLWTRDSEPSAHADPRDSSNTLT